MQATRMVITAASIAFAAMLAPANADDTLGGRAHSQATIGLTAAAAHAAKVNETKAALRDLWVDHVFWVRSVVVAKVNGDAGAQEVAEKQVVANAQSIAGSIEPFYGPKAKEQLFTLLAGHYGAIKSYLDASIAKDPSKQSVATTKLLSNATEIAVFLSAANPFLPKDAVEGLLQAHGGHHITQIQQLQAKDYAGEAQTWAEMTQHVYVVADAMADALARQFTEKF